MSVINHIRSLLEFFVLLSIVLADTSAGLQRYTILRCLVFWIVGLPLALYNLPLTIMSSSLHNPDLEDLSERPGVSMIAGFVACL